MNVLRSIVEELKKKKNGVEKGMKGKVGMGKARATEIKWKEIVGIVCKNVTLKLEVTSGPMPSSQRE